MLICSDLVRHGYFPRSLLVGQIKGLVILLVVLCVALMTLAERKVMGAMQRRVGPNKVGLLQPFADGIKLVLKETIIPLESSNWLF